MPRGQVDRHGAAVALHDQQLAPVALAGQLGGQRAQVAVDDRLHKPVDGRGRAALELAVLGQELGPYRDVGVGPERGGDLARLALVRVVDVRVHEVDHQGLDALPAQPQDRLAHLVRSQRRDHEALGVDALVHLEAEIARDQRLEVALEPVGRGARAPAQLQHVAEAARGDEPGAGALALEQRVGRGGRPVDDDRHLGRARRGPGQRALDPAGLVGHGRRNLGHPDQARGLVDEHQVGEGAADVDADELGLRDDRSRHRHRDRPREDPGRDRPPRAGSPGS